MHVQIKSSQHETREKYLHDIDFSAQNYTNISQNQKKKKTFKNLTT